MKPSFAILSVLAAALAVSPVCAAETTPTIAYPATQSGPNGSLAESVHRGCSRNEVIAKIGLPGTQLSPDIWIYWNKYRCDDPAAVRQDYDTLIITFTDGQVGGLKLVNARILAAELKRRSEGSFAVNSPPAR
jgi:hypothetical protein